MSATRTTYDAVLKEFYEGTVRDNLNSKIFLANRIKKDSKSWSGRRIVFPVNTSRNQGIGARSESASLPAAQEQGFAEARITPKYLYGRFRVSGPLMASTKGNAFVQAMTSAMKGLQRDLMNDVNRQLFSDGSGVLCQVNGAVADSTAVIVDNPNTRFLAQSMKIDTYDARTGGTRSNDSITISSVDSTLTFSLSANATITNDYYIVREDSYGAELSGLLGIVDTGLYVRTLFNIDRSTTNLWKANVLHNSGSNRSLSLELMQQAVDSAEIAGNGQINFLCAHTSVRRSYITLLTPDVRFMPMELRGGMKKLKFAGGEEEMDFEFDKDCDYNRIYFLSLDNFTWFVLKDFHFAQEDGSILYRVADTDEYEGWLKAYVELGCDAPNAQCVLKDVSATGIELGNYQMA